MLFSLDGSYTRRLTSLALTTNGMEEVIERSTKLLCQENEILGDDQLGIVPQRGVQYLAAMNDYSACFYDFRVQSYLVTGGPLLARCDPGALIVAPEVWVGFRAPF